MSNYQWIAYSYRHVVKALITLTIVGSLVNGCATRDGGPAIIKEKSVYEGPDGPEHPGEIIETPAAELETKVIQRRPKSVPVPLPSKFSLQGQLVLTGENSNANPIDALAAAVIYFTPDAAPVKAEAGRYELQLIDKRFVPDVLVIPVGSEVIFPNQDDILHSVFSVSSTATFDFGFYGNGESQSYVFNQEGKVLVNCSVHQSMSADILVLGTPFYTQPDAAGNFHLDDLPIGTGQLFVWHPQAQENAYPLTINADDEVMLKLELTKPLVPLE